MTKDGYPLWEMSEASKLLKEDINNGLHKNMTPDDFWNSRAEYKMFPKIEFRKLVHQGAPSHLKQLFG
jgi:hypothetical protein